MATKKATAPEGLDEAKKRLKTSGRTTPALKKSDPITEAPTSAAAWKKDKVGGVTVRVPSGKIMKIRTPGMEAFVRGGQIPNQLLPLVQKSLASGREPKEQDLEELFKDEGVLENLLVMADNILVSCAVEPPVEVPPMVDDEPVPFDSPERDPDTLYADEVDFVDKMYIFNVAVGGTQELERFREQSGLDVGVIPA